MTLPKGHVILRAIVIGSTRDRDMIAFELTCSREHTSEFISECEDIIANLKQALNKI